MKPAIAKRSTTCYYCKETIEPGSKRLDDIIKNKSFYRRIHYHVLCFEKRTDEWFAAEQNRIKEKRPKYGGREPLPENMTDAEKDRRKRIFIRLSGLLRYYKPKLIVDKPAEQLTLMQVRDFENFELRYRQLITELATLGGVPEKYASMNLTSIQEKIKQANSHVVQESVAV